MEKLAALDPRLSGLRVVPCATLYDALREALGLAVDTAPASGRGRGKRGGGRGGEGDDGNGGDGGVMEGWEGEGGEGEE